MKDDAKILFNLKCYLESLLASGQDKIFYNDLLNDEKTIDCINAIEDLLKERKKYTILLTDKEYRKVIENAQKNIAEQKDKRIQELEKENADLKKYNKTVSDRIVEYKKNSIPTQVVIDEIDKHNEKIEKYNEYREQGKETDVEYYENIANTAIVQVLQELLGGEK